MTENGARGAWGSKFGFVLAAAGSAIGLGNIWRFPYITGDNGGGSFVLVYLICIMTVGLPIMIGEVMLGRMSQRAAVGAFKHAAGDGTPWRALGGMGVLAGFFMLSFYSIVAGWALYYTFLSITGGFSGMTPADAGAVFGGVVTDGTLNIGCHVLFMALTTVIVIGGVQKGIERGANLLMPALLVMMLFLLYRATQMDGFGKAIDFVFGGKLENPETGEVTTTKLGAAGILEALGHSFFTLSLGMGAMITYGSYLKKESSLVANSIAISVLDTVIALLACMILFPIAFTYGMAPNEGAGFVFATIPQALVQLTGGGLLSAIFFGLLVFAALTSAISLLEVVASYFIDEWKMSRAKATVLCAVAITLFGIPSALSEVEGTIFEEKEWFDNLANLVSNYMLPIGGLGIAVFVAWRLGGRGSKDRVRAPHVARRALRRMAVPAQVDHPAGDRDRVPQHGRRHRPDRALMNPRTAASACAAAAGATWLCRDSSTETGPS